MSLELNKMIDIIETMENYIEMIRPNPEIRDQLDLGYEISGQSIFLNEIRPIWPENVEYMTIPYAKTTYLKSKDQWRVYWMRSDLKWHAYSPAPIVNSLKDFLHLVEKDSHGCFKG
jgi:hypothetical protein